MDTVLTDREKLIISSLIIKRQSAIPLSIDDRIQLLKDYSIGLHLTDKEEIYYQMAREKDQLQEILTSLELETIADYFGNYTNLGIREKYILYNIELMFVDDLPLTKLSTIKSAIMVILGIKDDKKLLELVEDQVNQTIDYLEYRMSKV
jgi:hypothetical protein